MKKPSRSFKAKALKTFAVAWLRFNMHYDLVCTEDPYRNSDALGTNLDDECTKMTEIEVKVDMNDLKSDKNKTLNWSTKEADNFNKHEVLATVGEMENKRTTMQPSQFYFLVPTEMLEQAKAYIEQTHPHAGIMHANPMEVVGYKSNPIQVAKTAKVLHKLQISKKIKRPILMRTGSEYCGVLIKNHAESVRSLVEGPEDPESQNEAD